MRIFKLKKSDAKKLWNRKTTFKEYNEYWIQNCYSRHKK